MLVDCAVAKPDIIYDLSDFRGKRLEQMEENGYAIVYQQHDAVKVKFGNRHISSFEFIAVRAALAAELGLVRESHRWPN